MLEDNLTIGIGVKVGPAKANVSADLYKLGKGVAKVFESGISYLSDYVDNIIN